MTESTNDRPLRDAWNEVADGFAKLGQAMRERYRAAGDTAAADEPAGDGSSGMDGLREALDRLVEAGREIGQRSGEVLRDPDVSTQAKQAARALNEALSETVDLIGREVGELFDRGKGPGGDSDATPGSAPPS